MTAGPSKPPTDALLGRSIGEFRLDARIGAGATGVVYRGVHLPSGRRAAVKVLNDHLGRISSLERRFRREARVLTRLDHPNIVHIFEFGVADDATFIAMELLEGRTLERAIRTGQVPGSALVAIGRAIAAALAHAHRHEVVHRDLKPANVFLCDHGEPVKLLDFGLAKILSIDELSGDVTLTRKGRVVGTPAYMAPEQITGTGLDPRADLYAFGVLFFEAIAGRRPFEYAKRSDLLRAHLFEPPPKLSALRPELRIDPGLEAIVARCLAKDPDHRFQSAAALDEALAALPSEPVVAGDAVSPLVSEGDHGDTSSVVIFEDELREAREGLAIATKHAERPQRGRSSRPSRESATSTDEALRPAIRWALALALAVAAGCVSYWVGTMIG